VRALLARLWAGRRALLFYSVLLLGGCWLSGVLGSVVIPELRPQNEPTIHNMVMVALCVFVLAAAIPFVPGAEIGFALLVLFGGQAAFVVYAGMVSALVLSFVVAKCVPVGRLARVLRWLQLERLATLVLEMDTQASDERSARVAQYLPAPIARVALSNRYLMLALLINLPGNSVLGGGGGLAFMASLSGLYRFWPYVLTVACAVSPIPLFFFLTRH